MDVLHTYGLLLTCLVTLSDLIVSSLLSCAFQKSRYRIYYRAKSEFQLHSDQSALVRQGMSVG